MKKSVIIMSAIIMVFCTITMVVGFSAAWFANIVESSNPIIIGSGEDSGYIIITPINTPTNKVVPAQYKPEYLLTHDDDGTNDVLHISDPNSPYIKQATACNYDFSYVFYGPNNVGENQRKIFIKLIGIYTENVENDMDNLANYTNYSSYIESKIGTSSINTEKGMEIDSVVGSVIDKRATFYFKYGEELIPNALKDKPLYCVIKVSAPEVANG